MKRLVILATFTLVIGTSGVVIALDERVTSTPPLAVTASFKTVAALRSTLDADCVEPETVYSRQQRPEYVSA
jgi:hypothetical protein